MSAYLRDARGRRAFKNPAVLGASVDAARRLVEHEDRRVREQRVASAC